MKILIQDNYFFNWQGGANYIRNLTKALRMNGVEVNQVALSSEQLQSDNTYDHRYLFKYPERFSFNWTLGKLKFRDHYGYENPWIFNQDVCFQVHQDYINSHLPTIRWIPDFQHVELPENFSEEEIHKRDRDFKWIAEQSDKVILSSHHAASIFKSQYPEYASKAEVLQFTVDIPTDKIIEDRSAIAKKYELPDRYIHFPGQWWKHKNHELILDALNDNSTPVVFTGSTDDYRHPELFKSLEPQIDVLEKKGLIKILGNIPYADMLSVMYHADAVINPSRYEGWSTTIEEAKMLGKRIYASEIEVNKEQLADYPECKLGNPNNVGLWEVFFEEKNISKSEPVDFQMISKSVLQELNKFGRKAKKVFVGVSMQ